MQKGWHADHRTIDGMIATNFQFRLRPNSKNWGTFREIGGMRESVGHVEARVDFGVFMA